MDHSRRRSAHCLGSRSSRRSVHAHGIYFSPDYGATWTAPEIAITSYGGGVPDGIIADDNWVHLMAEPGIYVRRRVPPVFRSIRCNASSVVLEWAGQATLQWSGNLTGPWTTLPG